MKLYIYTQVRENYGSHSWDGVGEVPLYWKDKGSEVYFVADVSASQACELGALGLKALADLGAKVIEHRDAYSEEYCVDWALLSDEDAANEDWETVKTLP